MAYPLRKRILAWLLPAVLVFAQHGAMAHVLSHISDESTNSEKSLAHLKLCGKCLSAEKLLQVPAGQEHRLQLVQAHYCHSFMLPALFHSANPLRQSCRDPPKSL